MVDVDHLPEAVVGSHARPVLDPEDAARRHRIVDLLRDHRGNVSAVARAMGKARMQLQRWLKRYEIEPTDFH